MMDKFQLTAVGKTEAKHPEKSENQDTILYDIFSSSNGGVPCGLFIVADGVGGHKDGSLASRTAVETIHQEISSISEQIPNDLLEAEKFLQKHLYRAISLANEKIYSHAKQQNIRMASTVTCALVYDYIAVIANIGDSRTYLFNGALLEKVTKDHSVVEWLVRQGHLSAEEAANHPYKNVIMQALGSHETPETDIFIRSLEANDTLLLCSDGIWDTLSDNELRHQLQQADSLETAVSNITAAAQDHTDDLSLILAQLTSPR